jgi:glycosyltransferase involved in cell wall biosynthesis
VFAVVGAIDENPSFEAIIVDDGSTETAPEFIRSSNNSLPLTLIRQSHAGIPASRNRGIRASGGTVRLFVDADSRLEGNCLEALEFDDREVAAARLLSAPACWKLLKPGRPRRRA